MASIFSLAQQKTAKVTLKNGTSLTGIVTDFDPTSHVTIVIAGLEKKIDMADVESVEDLSVSAPSQSVVNSDPSAKAEQEPDYPSTYTLKVGPYEIEMVLVKGDTFSMGYDGPGSVKMMSEPVHRVQLSSYYLNKEPLSNAVAQFLKQSKDQDTKEKRYIPYTWTSANDIVVLLAQQTSLPLRLVSEAEWEYAATSMGGLFLELEKNYCIDFYSDFVSNGATQKDPTGPSMGNRYLFRTYSSDARLLYNRNLVREQNGLLSRVQNGLFLNAVRFTMPASCVLTTAAE